MWDAIIIGGGAAGLWAAGTAAERGRRVLVLEKNRKAGVKILMSGGTRCNITHDCGIDGILQAFGQQSRFLKPALFELPPHAVVEQLNRLGVATKVEEPGKVFPVSDRAIDVRDALVRRLTAAGAELRSGVAVSDVRPDEEGGWQVSTEEQQLKSAKVLLCTGGLSYAACGTTGDGYAWTRRCGHGFVQTFPALTPLLCPAAWVQQLSGMTLPDVEVRVCGPGLKSKEPRITSRGGLLWTHFGCSGPAPMNVSRFVSATPPGQPIHLQIDLVPTCTEQQITQLLTQNSSGRRSLLGVLQGLVPRNLAICLLNRANLQEGVTLAELPRPGRLKIVQDLKRLDVPLSGTRGYSKAEVTRGGVPTKEVNPHTMESRLAPGLFLAGEILDVDGPIGGYNFQAAFSTGHAAGRHL
jgi:predicted Rossmann fold flavoprotein